MIEFSKKISIIEERMKAPLVPVVVACGVLNSGKSSLLNMLTEHFESEYFPTGDRRVTRETKKFEKNGICYMDTPGLDADRDDEREAEAGILNADVLLFVHGAEKELEQGEIEFLKKFKGSHGASGLSRLVVVIGKADRRDDEFMAIMEKIKSQISRYVGRGVIIAPVSCNAYRKGVLEGKKTLTKHGGVAELKFELDRRVKEALAKRSENLLGEVNALLGEVDGELERLMDADCDFRRKLISEFSSFSKAAKQLESLSLNN